jgi:pimeloyl-ACP methyl ester carboxylesterase
MEHVRNPYRRWKPQNIRGKRIWSRYKEGTDHMLPSLVLFTGLGINGTRLNPAIDMLETRYKGDIIGVELPGQGISQRLRFRTTAAHFAAEIEQILDSVMPDFNPKRAVFIGHCHSPFFINAYAQKKEVAGTVLLNPFPLDSLPMMARSCIKLGDAFRDQFWGKLRRDGERFRSGRTARELLTERIKKFVIFLEAGLMWGTSKYGTQMNESPVLIAIGKDDDVISLSYAESLSKRIMNSELVVMKGCTHFSTFRHPETTVKLILEFVDRIGR